MKLATNLLFSLQCAFLSCGLCLLIGCSADPDDDPQPAQLIRVTSYNSFRDITVQHLPKGDADGILAFQDWIELVFDKAVLEVIIEVDNVFGKAKPNGVPPTTIWQLKGQQLDVWSPRFSPERNASFTIIYQDKTGLYKETLDVTLGSYHVSSYPPVIESSTVFDNQVDVDFNQLNREGIKIGFDKIMDTYRTQIEIYSAQGILDWEIDCWQDKNMTVILLPENKDDWLLPEHNYEIHLVAYDIGGQGMGTEESPVVIRFQTTSAEPDGE